MALRDDVLKYWPQFAWALDVPDIAAVLEEAVGAAGGGEAWSSARLLARLQDTPWWKGTTPKARENLELSRTDPAAIDQQKRELEAKLNDFNRTSGANIDTGALQNVAGQAIMFGWNDQQMQDAIIAGARANGYKGVEGQIGSISTTVNALKQTAKNYYANLDDNTAFQWATQVAAGEKQLADFNVTFQEWGKSKFSYSPEITQAIDRGMTVRDYLAPFQQEAAKTLEIQDPSSVDFINDPKFSKVLDTVDEKGQRRMMTISEAQKYYRSMDQWKSTRQGQQAAADMAQSLLTTFGKVAS